MEKQPSLLIEQISPEDWDCTPETVKLLVQSLHARVMQYEAQNEVMYKTISKSASLCHQIIQTQADFVLRSLPDTTITFANEALCQALGFRLEQITGQKWKDFVSLDELQDTLQSIAALTPEDAKFTTENRDRRANEQVGWTQWLNQGVFDERGQLIEIQSVGRDVTDIRQTEIALREEEERQRTILNLNRVGTWDWYMQSDHLIWNDQVFELLGIDPAIPPSFQAFRNTIHPEDVESLEARLMHSLSTKTDYEKEYRVILPDGSIRWLQAKARSFYRDGQPVRMSGILLDISDRKQAEAALRESEARFRNMAANVPGAIFRYLLRLDGSDTVVYMSPGCYDLWEVEAEVVEADATILWKMTHPEDLPAMYESVMASARTLQPWSWAWRIITPSGREKWLESAGRPERQANGDTIWDTVILDVSGHKQAESALRESETRFRYLFESTPQIAVHGYNRQRQVIYWNDASERFYGYTKAEATGKKLEDLIIPLEMQQQVIEDIQSWYIEGRQISAGELNLRHKDGSTVAIYSSHIMLANTGGELEMYCVDIDLSDRKQVEANLRESEERYRLLAENINDLVCLHHPDGRYLYVSPSCESLLGYRHDEMVEQDPYSFFHPEDRDRIYQESQAVAMATKPVPITYRMRQKSGKYIWFETLTKPIIDANGQIVQLQTTSRDVTERIEVQNRLKHDALHDTLTGLPNRNLLMERLELAIHRTKRIENYHFAVLFLDLDRFKVINDSLGHLAGDLLLIAIGQKLESILRSTDLAVRLGGDEFVILIEEIKSVQEAVRTVERIFAELSIPPMLEGREVYTTASIGIVFGTKDYSQASDLLRDADIAMYRAKNQGRSRYEIFDIEMHTQALKQLHLENDLRKAIERQEFILYYQPIVDLDTLQIIGFEALVRWQHPTQGLKFPQEFIAVAEETGLITAIDYWALRTACHQIALWRTAFPERSLMKVSVNLSVQDLRQPDLLTEVDRILAQTHLDGSCLTLEITESMLIEDVESTIVLLGHLKERGIQISIDDFGTGYSSLGYLHRLPVDSLKIDRSFVSQMQEGKRNHRIAETIAALSNQLEIDAIAEGIETQQQLEQLRQIGYKFGQGYLFSEPLSHDTATALLNDKSRAIMSQKC